MARDRISAAVRAVMAAIPRERFVPAPLQHLASLDEPLPIGLGQTISQPTVVAIMTTALELTGAERVLEVGTGSGFQTAVLARLSRLVYSIEIHEALATRARQVLDELAIDNVRLRVGDGYAGWPEEAPFDRVICTAAPTEVPDTLFEQLAEGGILVAPVGERYQELVRVRRRDQQMAREHLGAVRFVPMVHAGD